MLHINHKRTKSPNTPKALHILECKHATALQTNTHLKHVLLLTYTALLGYLIYKTLKPKSYATQPKPTTKEEVRSKYPRFNY